MYSARLAPLRARERALAVGVQQVEVLPGRWIYIDNMITITITITIAITIYITITITITMTITITITIAITITVTITITITIAITSLYNRGRCGRAGADSDRGSRGANEL